MLLDDLEKIYVFVLKDIVALLLLIFGDHSTLIFLDSCLDIILLNLTNQAKAIVGFILDFKSVEKSASLLKFRDKVNAAVEPLDNQLRNDQPKPNSLEVELLFLVLDGSKHLKEFLFILVPNAYARVRHRDPDGPSVDLHKLLDKDKNSPLFVGELQSIGVKVEEHLLQSFLIGPDQIVDFL